MMIPLTYKAISLPHLSFKCLPASILQSWKTIISAVPWEERIIFTGLFPYPPPPAWNIVYFEAVIVKPKQNTEDLVLHSVDLSTVCRVGVKPWKTRQARNAPISHSLGVTVNNHTMENPRAVCRTSLAFQDSTERLLFTNLEVKL